MNKINCVMHIFYYSISRIKLGIKESGQILNKRMSLSSTKQISGFIILND